jgi:hypothetical protein
MVIDELTERMKLRLMSEARVMPLPLVIESRLRPYMLYFDW